MTQTEENTRPPGEKVMEPVIVLFVDDEKDFRTISIRQIKRIMKDVELEFIEAANGAAALELLKGGLVPAVIILDYAMPKLNGLDLLRKIETDIPSLHDVPRIMISGYCQEDIQREAQQLRYTFFEKSADKIFFQEVCRYMADRLGISVT